MLECTILQTEEELAWALDGSQSFPVLLFKHSLICPISDAAFEQYEGWLELADPTLEVQCFLIRIQEARPLSNEVERHTGVKHESPQALLMVDGKVVWHASHGAITEASLAAAIEEHASGLA